MTRVITSENGAPASSFCLGTMQFGGSVEFATSKALFSACRDAEINFFDTAHVYTGGASEEFLGQLAKPHRETLIIATKLAYTGGSGAKNIQTTFDKSLSRLDMDFVDILYLHRWDPDTALEETFETLATLQNKGRIRYLGVSNFAAWQVMKAQAVARTLGTKIDIIQPMYSLVKRQAEVELLPMAQSEGLAVAAYSPLGAGLLTGKYASKDATGRLASDARYAARYGQAWMHETAQAFCQIAAEMGTHPATAAVAWVARNPAITAPIISARNVKQLQPSLAAKDLELSAADYQRILETAPTPAPATDRLEEA